MPLRQTIGISLALLMASTGAIAKAPDKDTAFHPTTLPNTEPGKSGGRSGKSRAVQKTAPLRWPARLSFHRVGRARPRHMISSAVASDGSPPETNLGPVQTTGYQPIGREQIGQAAWYDLVGNRTSSGEPLDTVTPTAAHLTLPLGSCAKVTSLDTGRSVIVKINDRGPYNRRFIIDLSPRAAQEIGMIRAGVAAVAVEPVAAGPATANATTAVYRGQSVSLAR